MRSFFEQLLENLRRLLSLDLLSPFLTIFRKFGILVNIKSVFIKMKLSEKVIMNDIGYRLSIFKCYKNG